MATPQEIEEAAQEDIYHFLDVYNISNDQGQPLDFIDHPYLWDIYGDWSQEIACLKAAQIGFSTLANIKALWLAKNKKLDIIYSLPAASDIHEFVAGKTNRLISNNSIFQQWTADKDSIEQKRVGDSVIYYRGTWTDRAALMIPADLYIADEVDRSKQEVVMQYSTRLQHSDYKWRWYFSNPSTPGYGVDVMWEKSDQKHYFYQCDCGHWQYLTMDNIMTSSKDMGTPPYFGCIKCKKELSRRYNHGKAKWVRKYNDRKISGYWISLLMNPKVSAQEILDKKKEYTDAQFANYVLGQPFLSKGSKLIATQFMQNLTNRTNPMDSRVIIGVDTGNAINYVCGNKSGLFYYGKSNGYTEVRNLMKLYPNAIMLIDNGGDITGPKQLKEDFPNRVYTCFLRNDRKNDELWKFNEEDMSVAIDRNKLLQLCVDEMAERRVPIYGSKDDWWDFWIEWDRMRRVEDINESGDKTYQWQKTPGQRSDWPFCFTGETLVKTYKGDIPIKDIKVGDFVLTRYGYKRVVWSGMTQRDADVVKITQTKAMLFAHETISFTHSEALTRSMSVIQYTYAKGIHTL